jgi:hypothetical protein
MTVNIDRDGGAVQLQRRCLRQWLQQNMARSPQLLLQADQPSKFSTTGFRPPRVITQTTSASLSFTS